MSTITRTDRLLTAGKPKHKLTALLLGLDYGRTEARVLAALCSPSATLLHESITMPLEDAESLLKRFKESFPEGKLTVPLDIETAYGWKKGINERRRQYRKDSFRRNDKGSR